jgi:HSP20 family protein
MVEITFKSDPLHLSHYNPEEPQYRNPEIHWHIYTRPLVWRPPTDVYETEDIIVVRVEIAGMREADFNVSLEERILTIHGVRPDTSERRAYHQMEIPFGEFSTEVELPSAVIVDEIEASYRDGFLKIILPKARPHHIQITD